MSATSLLPHSEAVTHALEVTVICMGVSLAALFLVLISQKLFLERRRQNEDAVFGRLSSLLRDEGPEPDIQYDPRLLAHRRALTRALTLASGLEANEALRALYPHLIEQLQRDAQHARWGRRAAAYEGLSMLGLGSLRPYFLDAARKEEDPRVLATILQAIARLCGSLDDLHALSELLTSKPALSASFNEGVLLTAFESLKAKGSPGTGAQWVQQYLEGIAPSNPLLRDALGAAGRGGITVAIPLLERLCTDPATVTVTALRVTCLRALGRLQPDHPLLLGALTDSSWLIRTVGSRHLRSTDPKVIDALKSCLRDTSHFVRRNAARALFDIGDEGRRVLHDMARDSDPFGRETGRFLMSVRDQSHV